MDDTQEVKTVIEEVGIVLQPAHPKRKFLSNLIQRTWSALWGWDGHKLRRLICSSAGRLNVKLYGDLGLACRQNSSGDLSATMKLSTGYSVLGFCGGHLAALESRGCKEPSFRAEMDEAGANTIDFGDADNRIVEARGPFEGTDSYARVYDSDSVLGVDRLVGIVGVNSPLICFTKGRYLDVVSTTVDNYWSVLAWEL